MAAYRYVVRGRVQGVGYRYFVWRQARDIGLGGYCRNLPDGTVEVVAEGDEAGLGRLEDRLRKGPSFARVEHVDRAPAAERGDDDFDIR